MTRDRDVIYRTADLAALPMFGSKWDTAPSVLRHPSSSTTHNGVMIFSNSRRECLLSVHAPNDGPAFIVGLPLPSSIPRPSESDAWHH